MRYRIAADCIAEGGNFAIFFSPIAKVSKLTTRKSVAVLVL